MQLKHQPNKTKKYKNRVTDVYNSTEEQITTECPQWEEKHFKICVYLCLQYTSVMNPHIIFFNFFTVPQI